MVGITRKISLSGGKEKEAVKANDGVFIIKTNNADVLNQLSNILSHEDVKGKMIFIDDNVRNLRQDKLRKYQAEITQMIINL